MEYVIPLILVLLLVSGFVTFVALNAAGKSSGDGSGPTQDGPPGIGPDETPLGDTSQHAGETDADGNTVPPAEGGQRFKRNGTPVEPSRAERRA